MRYLILVGLFLAGCSTGSAEAPSSPAARAAMTPATASTGCDLGVVAQVLDCQNSPGSSIRVSGSVTWPGLQGKFIFSNAIGGPHVREDAVFELVLVPAGEITFDKEPSRGGVGGNPHIWFQLEDGSGNPMGDPVYLGRCVQGN